MAEYNASFPADDEYLVDFPSKQRNQQEALKDNGIVNAGRLQGKVTGNSSDNIPINNGTVNTNLNADMVDGKHANEFSLTSHTHNDATTSASGFMSSSDKTKLNGISTGAEVNQNAFANVKVGTTTVQADSKTDTLELVAGSNITLTPDATNDKVTIASTNTVTTATTSGDGNAVTSITANNGALTVTKGSTFLTSHQDISGKLNKSGDTMTGVLYNKNTNITRGTAPSSNQDRWLILGRVNSDKSIGGLYHWYNTDKTGGIRLYAYNNASTTDTNAYIGIQNDANGNLFTYAPTPETADNSTKIATTAFVKAQNYLTSHQSLSGYVPTSRTINSKALTGNITLTASDVGASASNHTHSYLSSITIPYGECATALGTIAKVVTVSGGTFSLTNGQCIFVLFAGSLVSSSNAFSNFTLNVNSKGAKTMRFYAGGWKTASQLKGNDGAVIYGGLALLRYNGTYWDMIYFKSYNGLYINMVSGVNRDSN